MLFRFVLYGAMELCGKPFGPDVLLSFPLLNSSLHLSQDAQPRKLIEISITLDLFAMNELIYMIL